MNWHFKNRLGFTRPTMKMKAERRYHGKRSRRRRTGGRQR